MDGICCEAAIDAICCKASGLMLAIMSTACRIAWGSKLGASGIPVILACNAKQNASYPYK